MVGLRASASALLVGLLMPASAWAQLGMILKANRYSQVRQNQRANEDDLSRMKDSAMLQRFVRAKYLEPVPVMTKHYRLSGVSPQHRYLRPWSRLFLQRLSQQYHARFKKRLSVTSLVRTVDYQQRLAKRNGNAAAALGPRASSHLTGATLDIAKRGMTKAELEWMRRVLHSLKQRGYLYAVEEWQQPVFHIMVYKDYTQDVDQQIARTNGVKRVSGRKR
jgi:uncharacterized protein YcbK (DUF882 family)